MVRRQKKKRTTQLLFHVEIHFGGMTIDGQIHQRKKGESQLLENCGTKQLTDGNMICTKKRNKAQKLKRSLRIRNGGLREEVAVLEGGDMTFRNLFEAAEGEEAEEVEGERTK